MCLCGQIWLWNFPFSWITSSLHHLPSTWTSQQRNLDFNSITSPDSVLLYLQKLSPCVFAHFCLMVPQSLLNGTWILPLSKIATSSHAWRIPFSNVIFSLPAYYTNHTETSILLLNWNKPHRSAESIRDTTCSYIFPPLNDKFSYQFLSNAYDRIPTNKLGNIQHHKF
jgi:hypothetical protein